MFGVSSDRRLLVVIFVALGVLVAAPFLLWQRHEAQRPVLLAARVVTATAADSVFRDGLRRLAPDEEVQIAVAVQLGVPGQAPTWRAPVERLALAGQPVDHVAAGDWPEANRVLRVFWFTVESSYLGGELSADGAAKRLAYRSFLAPEMGQTTTAAAPPEAHNDDHLSEVEGRLALTGGTLRLYARVEVAAASDDIAALQAVTTPGVESLLEPSLTTLTRATALAPPLDPGAGELLLAPGFELVDDAAAAAVEAATGASFADLVQRRLATSSATFALAALGAASAAEIAPRGVVERQGQAFASGGAPLRWGTDVLPGDVLVAGQRWLVLLADDGNGTLDLADHAVWCFKRPPLAGPLSLALGDGDVRLEHRRRSPA